MDNLLLTRLYQGIRNSDKKAFEKLYDLMSYRLYCIADSVLRNKMLSEEVISDVLTNLWIHRETHSIQNIFTFLYVATRNKAIDLKEKEKHHALLSIDDIQEEFFYSSLTPEDEIISQEEIDQIIKVIQRLPEKRRTAFTLAKYHGLKYHEIAEVMNISVKMVEKHMSAALRDIYEHLCEENCVSKEKATIIITAFLVLAQHQMNSNMFDTIIMEFFKIK
ncbi:MAG: sigma-70 family RNA polymerase sigma factor [Bacteroidales bacterium]